MSKESYRLIHNPIGTNMPGWEDWLEFNLHLFQEGSRRSLDMTHRASNLVASQGYSPTMLNTIKHIIERTPVGINPEFVSINTDSVQAYKDLPPLPLYTPPGHPEA